MMIVVLTVFGIIMAAIALVMLFTTKDRTPEAAISINKVILIFALFAIFAMLVILVNIVASK